MADEVLDFIARNLVDNPDDVEITETTDDEGQVVLELRVHPDDMGKVIGKRGRTAKAIRTMIKAASTRDGQQATVEIVE